MALLPTGLQTGAVGHVGYTNQLHKKTNAWVDVVADYGAVGDGTTNDTSAIQAAIDAAPNGGVVVFPDRKFLFSNLIVNKAITFQGSGWWNKVNDVFGNAQWADLSNMSGTVLKSTATTGNAIEFQNTPDVYQSFVKDLMVLGPGSGTSTGLKISVPAAQPRWENLLVANFNIGFSFQNVNEGTFDSLRSRGNKTGFKIDNSNQCVFINACVEVADTVGFDLIQTGTDQFLGGLIQGCAAGSTGVRADSNCLNNYFLGFHFENSAAQSYSFDLSGTANTVESCWFGGTTATNGLRILGSGQYSRVIGARGSPGTISLSSATQYALVACCDGTVADAGARNTIIGVNGMADHGMTVGGIRVANEHIGAATPTGSTSGEIRVGNGKIWAKDGGTWKSVAIT